MKVERVVKYLGLVSLLITLGGCVAGQTLRIDYTAEPGGGPAGGGPVTTEVSDKRPYVASGEKKPSYLGKYRGGFGNTFDVHAESNIALAAMMTRDLNAELTALGFKVANGAPRRLAVTVVEWNFDSYVNATVWYEIQVAVRDASGKTLAQATLKDQTTVEGSAWVGPKYAVEKEMPKIYAGIIRKIVRDNPAVRRALQ